MYIYLYFQIDEPNEQYNSKYVCIIVILDGFVVGISENNQENEIKMQLKKIS